MAELVRRKATPHCAMRAPPPLLVALVVCLRGAGASRACPLEAVSHDEPVAHRQIAGPEPGLLNCTWYAGETCCTPDDTQRISNEDPEISLLGTTRRCRDLLHLIQCSVCSPAQADIYLQERFGGFLVPVLRVADGFCERLYRQCGSSILPETHERVDLSFQHPNAFCHAVGLRTVSPADHAIAFSAAPRLLTAGLSTAIVAAISSARAVVGGGR